MFFEHTLTAKTKLNSKFYLFRFKTKDPSFSFQPGQFVPIYVDPSIFRCYSLASSGEELPFWQIFVDITPSGPGTTYLKSLRLGETIKTSDPRGQFLLNPKAKTSLFGATGCGIAPFLPMIDMLISNPHKTIFLFWGLRNQADIVLKEKLIQLTRQQPHFHYQIVLSQPQAGWEGIAGHITAPLVEQVQKLEKGKPEIYLSGSAEFIREATQRLARLKFPAHKVHFEACY